VLPPRRVHRPPRPLARRLQLHAGPPTAPTTKHAAVGGAWRDHLVVTASACSPNSGTAALIPGHYLAGYRRRPPRPKLKDRRDRKLISTVLSVHHWVPVGRRAAPTWERSRRSPEEARETARAETLDERGFPLPFPHVIVGRRVRAVRNEGAPAGDLPVGSEARAAASPSGSTAAEEFFAHPIAAVSSTTWGGSIAGSLRPAGSEARRPPLRR